MTASWRFGSLLMICCLAATLADGAEPRVEINSLLTRYCLDCHDQETREAEVNLSSFSASNAFLEDRRVWQRVDEVLTAQQMPPEGERQPTAAERSQMIDWVRDSLDRVDWKAVKAPGRVALARLTRAEYQYSIEDLFGVVVDLKQILPDDPEGLSGFANDRSSLMMTAKQLGRYLKAAELAAATVLDGGLETSWLVRYEVEHGKNVNWKKRPTKQPDGSVGWALSAKLGNKYQSVSKTFDFPLTGRYQLRIRAHSLGPGANAGAWIAVDSVHDASREAGVLVTGKRFDVYQTELFITQGTHNILFGYDFYGPLWLPDPPERPQVKLGQSTFDPPPYDRTPLLPNGITLQDLNDHGLQLPTDQRARGRSLIAVINEGYFPAVLDLLMLHKFHYQQGYLPVFLGGLSYDYVENVVPAFAELAELFGTEPAVLERIWKDREPDTFRQLENFTTLQRAAWAKQDESRKQQVGDLLVDWIEMQPITGDRRVPERSSDVTRYLDDLLPRAFRHPVAVATRDRFLQLYRRERASSADHRQALQRMLIAVLISPEFLYRHDWPANQPGVAPLDDHTVAARLASFLWSSLPDAKLNQAASNGQLRDVAAINVQVDRMLDDRRSMRLVELFTGQWLDLAGIGRDKEPDKELFRYFSWRLAEDMRTEIVLLFDRIVRDNRSVLELLDNDETFLNERLARLYNVEGVTGAAFRPVALNDRRRGGLLGTAAVLTSTSLATRTSPVRRGQFVLEALLDVDLPPPPAGIPELDDDAGQGSAVSLRESLNRHRADAKCAGCHAKIDPLGFALESFDWIGRWRERDPAGPVDATGTMPDGRQLDGVVDLKEYLLAERADDFVRALTKALLAYALGRELEYFDEDAIRSIVQETKTDGYRARTLLKAIAASYPFRYREIAPEDVDANPASSEIQETIDR